MYFVYFSGVNGVQCFSPSPEKDSPSCFCSFPLSSPVRLFEICCRSGLCVLTCAAVSHGVVVVPINIGVPLLP